MTKQTNKSSVASSSANKGVKKIHYPAAKISSGTIRSAKGKKSNRNEKFGLSELVQEICSAEEDSITAYLDAQVDLPNRQIIKSVLSTILQKLPEKVQSAGGNNTDFEPELSKHERAILLAKTRRLQELEELSARLQGLEDDVDALREETGLWLGHIPVDSIPSIPKSSQVSDIAGSFKSQLESMNSGCDKMLAFAQECKVAASKAESSQRRLYTSFDTLRKQGPATEGAGVTSNNGAAVPRETRDLLRTMPRFYR